MVHQSKKKKQVVSLLLLSSLFSTACLSSVNTFADTKAKVQAQLVPGGGVTPPRNPNDPDQLNPSDRDDYDHNQGTGETGVLTIDYVPELTFENAQVSTKEREYRLLNNQPFIQVSDYRGSDQGWSVQLALSELKSKGSGDKIKGAYLKMSHAAVKTLSGNVSSAATFNGGRYELKDVANKVVTATRNTGRGTWIAAFEHPEDVLLGIPKEEGKLGETYEFTMTWYLMDTPA